ncbi:MAG: hypothetical protein AAFY74_02180 [Pseudomonadota bacterium]
MQDDQGLTLFRRLPIRFDVSALAIFPVVNPLRLAHQIRQDMWRMLRRLRGFLPIVQVQTDRDVLVVTAGGSVRGDFPKDTDARISNLLHSAEHRARWCRFATERRKV